MSSVEKQRSKKLEHDDQSGFEFVKEMLSEDCTAAVNFDRLQKHPEHGYFIMEYLLCEEGQKVTPYTSHPNRYWKKNATKFLSLWRAKLNFSATLYLVNYAKKGTKSENEILLIKVLDMDETGIVDQVITKHTREEFSQWFRKLNSECLTGKDDLLKEIYAYKSSDELGKYVLQAGKYKGKTIEDVFECDCSYVEWFSKQRFSYSIVAACYMEKKKADH